MTKRFGKCISSFGLCIALACMATACAKAPQPAPGSENQLPAQKSNQPSSPQKPAGTKAQQQYYDRGLQYYAEGKYEQAKSAFQRVVELGPNSALGQNAQENLKKIQQMLKPGQGAQSK